MNTSKTSQNVIKNIVCDFCNYRTSKQNVMNAHLLTSKHKDTYNTSINTSKTNDTITHDCKCGKKYKHRQSLYTHKKKCTIINDNENIVESSSSVSSEIKELKEMIHVQNNHIIELLKNNKPQIINNNNTNNQFNLNVFLNEDCKDALTMEQFLCTISIELKDLENSQLHGYVDGLSKIIINGLRALELNKRPIHCSDLKREILYIKAGDIWEKDDEQKKNIKKAIKVVEHKTIKKIPEWKTAHPSCLDGTHRDNTTYLKMISQITGGDLEKEENNINKIIKNIASEVSIDKTK
jgi:hypothetical protein